MFLAISLPRLMVLDRAAIVDESKWLVRSANFTTALARGDYAAAYQREHPGVTTMWAGALGLAWLFPEYGDAAATEVDRDEFTALLRENGHEPLDALVAGRAVMVLANSTVLLIAFAYSRKLLGTAAGILGTLFIAFSPFQAAHTQILHLDGLMGSFMLLSLLAFLSFGNFRRRSDLVVSGVAAGLGWLTKSPALVLAPTAGLLALLFYWKRGRSEEGFRLKSLLPAVVALASWAVIGAITVIVLWPAMWVDPIGSVTSVLSSALGYAGEGHDLAVFFDGQIFPDGRIGPEVFQFYPLTYLWRSSPVVLLGLPASLVAFWRRDIPLHHFRSRVTVAGLFLSVLVLLLVMNLGTKRFDRYLIPAYAPLDLIAATGWVALVTILAGKIRSVRPRCLATIGLLGSIVLLQLLMLVSVYPYYLSYYNALLGGSKKAPEVLTIGWGEGLDAAANYLNQKPNSASLQVASWYRNSFFFYFEGQTVDIPGNIDEQRLGEILAADYAVIYIHQWQRELPAALLDRLGQRSPEHSVWFNGLEYARIYDLGEGP
jgi:hypothetical protein